MSDPILELLAAPPNPSMRVDEDAVHAGGRRRVRRRAARRGTLGLMGVVGAAAIAFATLGGGVAGDALPAGPSPSQGSAGRVSADVLDGRYAVEVVPGAPSGQPNVIYYRKQTQTGAMIRLAGSDASPDVVSLGTGSGAEGVMLGTAPADATAFLTVTRDGGGGGVEGDQQPLPGTDYQAVALKFENPAETQGYLDTIWLDGDGVVHHATGEVIPSVPVPGSEDRIFVARPQGQLMGVIGAAGGSHRLLQQAGLTALGYGEKLDDGDWTWRSSALLSADARDVAFRWSPSTRGEAVSLLELPDGSGVIATAAATAAATSDGPTLLEVTWTDKAGTRHTDPVG